MDGEESHLRRLLPQAQTKTLVHRHHPPRKRNGAVTVLLTKEPKEDHPTATKRESMSTNGTAGDYGHHDAKSQSAWLDKAYFMRWRMEDAVVFVRYHPMLCLLAACILFFMGVEYMLRMVPYSSLPFDLDFVATISLNRLLAARPLLNNFLAGLNTVTPQ